MSAFVKTWIGSDRRASRRGGRGLLVAVAFAILTLGAFAPACLVPPALAADEAVVAAPLLPHGAPTCCDELRGGATDLAARAASLPEYKSERMPAAAPLATRAFHPADAPASALTAAALPAGFAAIPPYLRTLRLRV